jgi:CheY-like chemotaxis protein
MKTWAVGAYCKLVARHRAKTTYPESLSLDLSELLTKPRPIRVVIVDDKPFPWVDALENRGCNVTCLSDYTRPLRQANQKLKTHELKSYDIIVCDIHGVGSAIYPGIEGIGVMEELRRKNPLHVIAAYTGNPGAIYSKMKRQNALDAVFSRDWGVDDFLLNFGELTKVFSSPRNRWEFIRRRLAHLEVGEKKIADIQRSFVEQVLFGQMLRQQFRCDAAQTREFLLTPASSFDPMELVKFGIGAAELAGLLSPLFMEASK